MTAAALQCDGGSSACRGKGLGLNPSLKSAQFWIWELFPLSTPFQLPACLDVFLKIQADLCFLLTLQMLVTKHDANSSKEREETETNSLNPSKIPGWLHVFSSYGNTSSSRD